MWPKKRYLILLSTFLFLMAVLFITPFIGSQELDFQQVLQYLEGTNTPHGIILFQIRLPRILLGILTGASLAVAGVVFQALLRNPLATPYTLGVATGSALGALLVIKSGIVFVILGISATQLAAFLGSLLTVLLVYALSRKSGKISIHGMILAGVTINFFFAAMILFLHYISDFTETHQMIRWTIGGLDIVEYRFILQSLSVLLVSFVILGGLSRSFNILSTSEETALSKGVNVARLQKFSFVIASLITGTVVAFSGPIGFIGLIIPHLLRLLGGPDHRYLIPASIFFGGGFLVLADTIARTVLAPVDLPVGIITTLLGGPFFLWLLVQKR
jgi:iron complex transport system permease protein